MYPNMVNRNSYRGIEHLSKEMYILSVGSTRKIDQSDGFPTIISTIVIVATKFKVKKLFRKRSYQTLIPFQNN